MQELRDKVDLDYFRNFEPSPLSISEDESYQKEVEHDLEPSLDNLSESLKNSLSLENHGGIHSDDEDRSYQ